MRILLSWLLLMAAPAMALEARDARGLDVRLEAIPESIEVEGVPFRIQRATGPDVARLAARVGEHWRAAGSPLQEFSHGGWRMLSRWDGPYAELLQWRGQGASAELLHSRFDARVRATSPRVAPLRLPAGCRWERQISGMAGDQPYQYWTAPCRASVAMLQERLPAVLTAEGWQWREAGPGALHLTREGGQALVTLAPGRISSESRLVWIGTLAMREAGR